MLHLSLARLAGHPTLQLSPPLSRCILWSCLVMSVEGRRTWMDSAVVIPLARPPLPLSTSPLLFNYTTLLLALLSRGHIFCPQRRDRFSTSARPRSWSPGVEIVRILAPIFSEQIALVRSTTLCYRAARVQCIPYQLAHSFLSELHSVRVDRYP